MALYLYKHERAKCYRVYLVITYVRRAIIAFRVRKGALESKMVTNGLEVDSWSLDLVLKIFETHYYNNDIVQHVSKLRTNAAVFTISTEKLYTYIDTLVSN